MRRSAALLGALLLAGCSGLRTGPVARPDPYPDRTTPASAWHTFLWAYQSGDVPILGEVSAWNEARELKEALAQRGPEGTAAWCREAAADLAVIEAEWTTQGEELAYLRAVVSSRQTARTEWKVALLRRPDGWAVSDRRLVR